MDGILYLCATPIGNLSDMSPRIRECLESVDLIAAEDTRNSIKLLNHFGIHTPMTSYHEYNKIDKAMSLIATLREGKNIALITDAGTPAISDPGEDLVRMCAEAGITVTSLPGPCACITALTLSGLNTRRFVFEGFIPRDKKERAQVLKSLENETRTMIVYEAPHHLKGTLDDLAKSLNGGGNRRIALCRELTKKFEEIDRTTVKAAISKYETEEPRGEYVLVIEGRDAGEIRAEEEARWEEISVSEHVKMYEDRGMDRKEAMKAAAKDRGVGKREIYAAYEKESSKNIY
ncbi:MAG: 16S rRNA (cytidine(1402)-2'-O)-methyltransferase [Lachnospiraceae bacterium]|nr:16S rRNA (cytidine(1402)-2'-O)-methyltransferase [Lachnospiraceae bacterium]